MSAAGTETGVVDRVPNLVRASPREASGLTGYMYMFCGMDSWTSLVSIHSMKALAPAGLAAPVSTPAYSTWRKAVAGSEAVVELWPSGLTVAAGEEE